MITNILRHFAVKLKKKRENQPASLTRHLKTPHHNYENFITQKLKEFSGQNNGKFEPLCQVAIYYLEKKLKTAV